MARGISRKSALKALAVLMRYGRQGYGATARVGAGECLGYSIYALNDPSVVVDAAIESLEQWNGHLSAAVIRAIEKGEGSVHRDGRFLRITLPVSWEKQ